MTFELGGPDGPDGPGGPSGSNGPGALIAQVALVALMSLVVPGAPLPIYGAGWACWALTWKMFNTNADVLATGLSVFPIYSEYFQFLASQNALEVMRVTH